MTLKKVPRALIAALLALSVAGAARMNRVESSGGAGDSIVAVDSVGDVGSGTSLKLDSSGFPVISYGSVTSDLMKLAHCNDPNCDGGDESIVTVDIVPTAHTSLALDGSGYPVISYYDGTNGDLNLVHCNDPNCAGGDESIETVDSTGDAGLFNSLVLDSSGFPVISYWGIGIGGVKLAHCNDPNCAGGDESIVTIGGGPDNSLVLDSSGFPVIGYSDSGLKLLHCNDPNCVGGGESLVTVDTGGSYISLTLDRSGFPVISYYDRTNGDLKLAHCDDPNCALGPPALTETIYLPIVLKE